MKRRNGAQDRVERESHVDAAVLRWLDWRRHWLRSFLDPFLASSRNIFHDPCRWARDGCRVRNWFDRGMDRSQYCAVHCKLP